MKKRDVALIDYPIFEAIAHVVGKNYCEGHDGIVEKTYTYVNPDSGNRVDRCDDCRPRGWVQKSDVKG